MEAETQAAVARVEAALQPTDVRVWDDVIGGYQYAHQVPETVSVSSKDLLSALATYREKVAGLERERDRLLTLYEEWRQRGRAAMDLSYALNWQFDPDLLDRVADQIDCGSDCDNVWREHDTNATGCTKSESFEGCPFDRATGLREIATAIRLQAWMAVFDTDKIERKKT